MISDARSVLPDLLAHHLLIVFCGMAAGPESARQGAYYAGPGNRFWGVLHELGFTNELLLPCQYRQLIRYGIGLTDVVKISLGVDADVLVTDDDRMVLSAKVHAQQPDFLAFNGKRAAEKFLKQRRVEYGLQTIALGATQVFVLPSTSRAANGFWSIEPWRDLHSLVKEHRYD